MPRAPMWCGRRSLLTPPRRLVLAPLAPIYALPLQSLSNMPAGMWPLIALYAQVSWAMATFGYIFSLLSPANGTLLTAATTLILFAFFSGALIGPEMLPEALRCILQKVASSYTHQRREK